MRIHIFASLYPVPYKPYYDAQFADLVSRGHTIRIFAAGTHDGPRNDKVARFRLAERTTYFPSTLRSIPTAAGAIARGLANAKLRGVTRALTLSAHRPIRHSVANAARVLSVMREQPDLCLIHGLGTAVMVPWLQQVYGDVPVAMYFHGGEVPAANPLEEAAVVHAFKGVDVVFTNTEFSREQVIRRGCPPAKTCVLPVGFDLNDFTPTEPRLYRRRGILNLLSAGRISEEKGLLFVLQGLKALVTAGITDIHYAIAGDGYARTQLEDYVHSENLTSFVSFLGPLTATELTRVMGTTDALLISSIEFGNWAETQACTVQEAMLMKAIPITTIIGGVPESIPEEMKQFAVPQRDAQALARAIRTVYTLQVSELERLGSLGRRFVQSHYDVRRLNDRLIETTLERASKLRSR